MKGLAAVVLIVLFALAGAAAAQSDYPSRAIRMVAPFAAGGGSDLLARALAQKLNEQMSVPVLVENKPGANANIAAEFVVRAPADGHTLLFHTAGLALNPALYLNMSYDPLKDLAPVSLTGASPLVLAVSMAVPVNTVAEFIAYAKANPGKLSYASAGHGNITHLAAFLFLQANGLDAVHVPYKGGAPAVAAVAGNFTQFTTQTPSTVGPVARAGKIKALAVTTLSRTPSMPDVPTLNETGMPKFEISTWQAVMVNAKTQPAHIARLNSEIVKAIKNPEVRARFTAQDTLPIGSTAAEYGVYLKGEIERWKQTVKAAGIKPE
jgi:tripartite-type tricarboxylate transporter receptor subunit TctC